MIKKTPLSFYKQLQNQDGIALLMVLGVITILTFLLADFTFETKLNKIKVYNQQDKIQSRLNAEAGLNFAMAKLRLYQEGRNKIEKEASIKSSFPPSDLEAVLIEPFVYPIPMPKNAGIIQKTAIEEFEKNTIFRGELALTMTKISGFLNPNALRLVSLKNKNGSNTQEDAAETPENGDPQKKNQETTNIEATKIIYKQLQESLAQLIKDKSDEDESFHSKYANTNAEDLIDEIRYYVNSPSNLEEQDTVDVENRFNQKKITPKHAPMSSLDELYLLPSWDDVLVNLIKDRLSVHEISVISVNEISSGDLKILFPNINDIQIEEFFKYRDGDPDKKIEPKKFKDGNDFKIAIVNTLNIATDTEYSNRIGELEKAGLRIDTAGNLYRVNSRGSYNNAVYNLVAYIDLPLKNPPVVKKSKNSNSPENPNEESESNPNPEDENQPPADAPKGDEKKDKETPLEFKKPRIIEIRLE